jgi:hypothetical protein
VPCVRLENEFVNRNLISHFRMPCGLVAGLTLRCLYPGPVRYKFLGVARELDFLRVLRVFPCHCHYKILHTRLRLNIAVIRSTCVLNLGTF